MFNDRKYFCDRKSAFQAFFVIEKVLFKLFCDRKSAFQAFLWSLFCSDSQISHLRQIKSRRNSEKGNHAQTTYLKTFWSSHMKGIAHSVLYNLWTLRRRLIVCNTVSFHGKSCDSTVTGSHLTVTFGNPRPIPFPEERIGRDMTSASSPSMSIYVDLGLQDRVPHKTGMKIYAQNQHNSDHLRTLGPQGLVTIYLSSKNLTSPILWS